MREQNCGSGLISYSLSGGSHERVLGVRDIQRISGFSARYALYILFCLADLEQNRQNISMNLVTHLISCCYVGTFFRSGIHWWCQCSECRWCQVVRAAGLQGMPEQSLVGFLVGFLVQSLAKASCSMLTSSSHACCSNFKI